MMVSVDTNILVYAEGIGDDFRVNRSAQIVRLLTNRLVIPTQVIGEFFNVLRRKANYGKHDLIEAVATWSRVGELFAAQSNTMAAAIHLSVDHEFQIWDALIVQTAIDAGCEVLLSEDMQHGFYWAGLTIINPFEEPEHPLLSDALSLLS